MQLDLRLRSQHREEEDAPFSALFLHLHSLFVFVSKRGNRTDSGDGKSSPDIDGLSYRPKPDSRSVVNRRNPLRFLQASGLAIGPGGLKNFPISV